MADKTSDVNYEEDPVFLRCLWEAKFIMATWTCCFLYTTIYCYLFGYAVHEPPAKSLGPPIASLFGPLESFNRTGDSLTFPFGLGIPDWIFWGIVTPWTIATLVSFAYGLFIFAEDDLSVGADELAEAADKEVIGS